MLNKTFFTPGPSQLYFTVPDHIKSALRENVPSISHRSQKFRDIFQSTRQNLKLLLNVPDDFEIFFLSSATEIWERIIQNCVIESSHHIFNGSFGERFYEVAQSYQIYATKTELPPGNIFRSITIEGEPELIAFTQNETSTGYYFRNEDLIPIRKAHPDALIALDIVSSVPIIPIPFNEIDTAYFSVQKCFGLPSGLGVWLVNNRCIRKGKEKQLLDKSTGSYHSLESLKKFSDESQTPETPNVLGIYLLNKVVEDMLVKGISSLRNEATYKSILTYQMLQAVEGLKPFIADKKYRSPTVLVAEVTTGSAKLIEYLSGRGIVIGSGHGSLKDQLVRIANYPTHSKEQFEMLIDLITSYYQKLLPNSIE